MDDTISRREAIEALWKALHEYEDINEKIFQESEDLDIGDWIEHRIFVQNMNDIDRQTILNLPAAEPKMGWIPCRERLPKYGKTVLITNDKGNVGYGRFRGVEFWREDGDNFWQWKKNTIEHVAAWMPIPEPYKGE